MKITLSKYAGFCDGVARAYEIVEKIAHDPSIKRPVFVLGSLVHNDEVVKKIESLGVKKISIDGTLEEFFKKNKDIIGTLVITAHGVGPRIYELAEKYGVGLVDTTCPRVIKVQRLAKNFSEKDFQIVIIGEKNHKEVAGIFQWGKEKAVFIEKEADFDGLILNPHKKIVVLSQTTQDQEFVERMAAQISAKYPEAQVLDSICLATHERQSEIAELAKTNDVVIVIGDPSSSNSNRLWEVARKFNENSYFIQNQKNLNPEWFSSKESVALTAGASTPKWIIDGVVKKLKNL